MNQDQLDAAVKRERDRKRDAREAARERTAMEDAAGEVSETKAARQRIAEARSRAARRHEEGE